MVGRQQDKHCQEVSVAAGTAGLNAQVSIINPNLDLCEGSDNCGQGAVAEKEAKHSTTHTGPLLQLLPAAVRGAHHAPSPSSL